MDNMDVVFEKKIEEQVDFIETLFGYMQPKLPLLVELTDDIINFGDAEIIYRFADKFDSYAQENNFDKGIVDALIAKLCEAILQMRSSKFIFMFGKRFANIPVDRFARRVLQLGHQKTIETFADYLDITVEEFEERFALPPENPNEQSA